MNLLQRLITGLVPRAWADAMEADSRRWMVRCACGFERSIWELGGIRYNARGGPRWFRRCPSCGRRSWHTVYKWSGDN